MIDNNRTSPVFIAYVINVILHSNCMELKRTLAHIFPEFFQQRKRKHFLLPETNFN